MKNKTSQIATPVMITGLICLTAAEIYALSQGINGMVFALFAAIVGTAIGVAIPKEKIIG